MRRHPKLVPEQRTNTHTRTCTHKDKCTNVEATCKHVLQGRMQGRQAGRMHQTSGAIHASVPTTSTICAPELVRYKLSLEVSLANAVAVFHTPTVVLLHECHFALRQLQTRTPHAYSSNVVRVSFCMRQLHALDITREHCSGCGCGL